MSGSYWLSQGHPWVDLYGVGYMTYCLWLGDGNNCGMECWC